MVVFSQETIKTVLINHYLLSQHTVEMKFISVEYQEVLGRKRADHRPITKRFM